MLFFDSVEIVPMAGVRASLVGNVHICGLLAQRAHHRVDPACLSSVRVQTAAEDAKLAWVQLVSHTARCSRRVDNGGAD